MARIDLSSLHPLAGAVAGLSLGAGTILLVPGALGSALGLLLAGGGLILSLWQHHGKALALREQMLAGLGEMKVRSAANAIRLDNLSQRVELMPMRDADAAPARAAINELTAEVGLLGDLIHQIATTLADHDAQLAKSVPAPAPPQAAPIPVIDPETARRERQEALIAEREAAAREADRRIEDERAAIISQALSEGRVEVHLQPVVELPQRRTRGYEAVVRLRLDESTLLMPEQFLGIVENRGFGPTLDALVLTRTLAIARHLSAKASAKGADRKGGEGRDAALYVSCNFSRATWGSARALATLARILDKYREHAESLVIEIPQPVFRVLDPASLGLLGAMATTGVRFALDQLADLRFDPASLFERGVRFVKAPAALLQAEMNGDVSLDIAASDLSTLLARASIILIAEEVTDNPAVADMIELGVGYAQGNVFSPPRPVKPEVFAEPETKPAPDARDVSDGRGGLDVPGAPAGAETPLRRPAQEQASAEVIGYPDPQPVRPPAEVPERLPFRSVLRRATA